MDELRTKMGHFLLAKCSKKYSDHAEYMRGNNSKVTHSKDHTDSQTTENGNTECHGKRSIPNDEFLEWTKFKASAENFLL